MKILNALIILIYAIVLGMFLSASAGTTTGTTYAVQLIASQKQLQSTDAAFKGVTDVHEETFTTGPVKYKYTTGWTNSWKEVKATWQKMVDAGFTGAFIVTYNSGNRVVKNTTTGTDGTATAWNTTNTTTSGTGNTAAKTTTPATTTTATVTTTKSTPDFTTGTTIFTTENGTTITMTNKKVTTTDGGTAQYETTTTTAPTSSSNTNWNWNTSTTTPTSTSTGNTGTTSENTNWNTTTPTTNTTNTNTTTGTVTASEEGTTTPTPTTHVYRGYGEKLAQSEPTFPGGQEGLDLFVRNHISYVLQTQSTGEWKHGYLCFTVDKTGKAMNPVMMTGITKEVDAAAIAMVKDMPTWTPASVSGTAVDKQFILALDCFMPAPATVTSTK